MVNATDFTCYSDYFNTLSCDIPETTTQSLAHVYGEMATNSLCCPYNDLSDILSSKPDGEYYYRRTRYQQEFAYRFNEYNPADEQGAYPRFTNRNITASSGPCFNYSVTDGYPVSHGDGMSFLKYENETGFSGNISIPERNAATDGNTYVFRGLNPPQNASAYFCGTREDRCLKMWAHRSVGSPEWGWNEPAQFYECPSTINHVGNTSDLWQEISDDMAYTAAAAIGLQGRSTGNSSDLDWTQFQF